MFYNLGPDLFVYLSRRSEYKVLVLIAYSQKYPINVHADVSRGARSLKLGLSLHLHPHFGYASREGSGESANLYRLV